ncbi:MAG: hypothetical protein AAB405_00345 [Patescibacteria group bacterium]
MDTIKIIFFLIIAIVLTMFFLSNVPNIISRLETMPPKKTTESFIQKPIYTPPATTPIQTPPPTPSPINSTTTYYLPYVSDYEIPNGLKREQLSPYFRKVRISSASAYSTVNYPSKISLNYYLNGGEAINITRWKIRSNKGEIEIPKAVDNYDLSILAVPKDIILQNYGYIDIYSNKSAINQNIRLNKCAGYLENFYDFVPSLTQNCPLIYESRAEIAGLAGYCQSYIYSLGSCKLPDTAIYNSFPGTDEGNACRAYLNTISYGTCLKKHSKDDDFFKNEWWLWVDKIILDQIHDRLRLFDEKELLVDEYIY